MHDDCRWHRLWEALDNAIWARSAGKYTVYFVLKKQQGLSKCELHIYILESSADETVLADEDIEVQFEQNAAGDPATIMLFKDE